MYFKYLYALASRQWTMPPETVDSAESYKEEVQIVFRFEREAMLSIGDELVRSFVCSRPDRCTCCR